MPVRPVFVRSMLLGAAASLPLAAATKSIHAVSTEPTPPALRAVVHDGAEVLQSVRAFLDETGYADSSLRSAIDTQAAELNQALFAFDALARGADLTPWEAGEVLLGRRIDLILDPVPGAEQPAFAVVIHLENEEAADRLLRQIHQLIGVANRRGRVNPGLVRTIDNVEFVRIGEEGLLQGRADDRLVLGNDDRWIRRALGTMSDATPPASPDAIATVNVDLAVLRAAMDADNLGDRGDDPLGVMLAGGWRRVLQEAQAATITMSRAERGVRMTATMVHDGAWPPSHRGFVAGPDTHRVWTTNGMTDVVGELSFSRDWASLFSEREMLMSLPAASQLTGFASGASTLFGRLDFVDDLLMKIDGPVRLIAAMPTVDEKHAAPTPLLPGLVLTAPLDTEDPDDFALRIRSAASTAISIVGLEQSQQDQASLLLDVDRIGDTRVVLGTYPTADWPDLPGVQFNFEPAVAYAAGDLLIASNAGVFRDALEAASGDAPGETMRGDAGWINVDRLADLLVLNRDSIITQRMLEENETRAEAIAFTSLLDGVLRPFDRLDAAITTDAASMTFTLEATFDGDPFGPEQAE